MKHITTLGLAAVAAVTLMAFAASAAATVTSPSGTAFSGWFNASSSNISLDGSVKVSCSSATVEGPVSFGSTSGSVSSLSGSFCGSDTVGVLKTGSWAVSSSGKVTSTGAEVTVMLHRTVLGFPVTTHCIYSTNNTGVGTLTEGVSPAVVHIGSSPIPEVETDGACGNDAVLTGSVTVNTPSSAITVD